MISNIYDLIVADIRGTWLRYRIGHKFDNSFPKLNKLNGAKEKKKNSEKMRLLHMLGYIRSEIKCQAN